ncbi:MAG: lytic transglycosylase domain-containing protein [Proteobacteria bacterium]|nr:lytic transglycosylase domain-containing protein [Pseudomonadota bacterium]
MKLYIYSLLFLLLFGSAARAQQVILPMTLDHKLLTSLIVREAFPGKNNSAAIVGRQGECTYLGISEPKFSSAGKNVRLDMRLVIRLGTELAGECLVPVEWQGYLSLIQQPVFDSRTFTLSFRTIDSSLSTLSRQPAQIANFLWEFAKPRVSEHLSRVRLNLAPPVRDMRDFLAPLFHEQSRKATQAMLDSLHGGRIAVTKDGVEVELLAEVEEIYAPVDSELYSTISPAEHKRLIQLWETWDVFLVRLISLLASEPLTPEDRLLLADVLLDTRHAFAAALEANNLEKDFVRQQFIRVWRNLAPMFRRQLYAKPSENTLGYLAFFTAADALLVLDQMGPTFGIEISEQGLLRLAAMLTGRETPLPYNLEVDPILRKLLQLPSVEILSPDGGDDEILEIDLPGAKDDIDPFTRISNFIFTSAYAADTPQLADLLEWRVPEDGVVEYAARVRGVLAEATSVVLAKQQQPENLHGLFRTMIVAIAWQESCFRQFVERGKKLTFLLSYNQTSVGVMQINERVWRGVYDRNKLRWDIRYNALAGCEIADLYLRRHALQGKALAPGVKAELLPAIVYAMYNGGPGQYEKFLARQKSGKTFPSDKLFAEKLKWVEKRDWERIEECLGGG